jgi:hypothetical protein
MTHLRARLIKILEKYSNMLSEFTYTSVFSLFVCGQIDVVANMHL